MTPCQFLWGLGISLQVCCILYCLKQIVAPYAFGTWRLVWWLRLGGDLCIMYRGLRIIFVLGHVTPSPATNVDDLLDASVQVLMSGAFLGAHYLMAQIFGTPLKIEPRRPAEIVINMESKVLQWNYAATQLFGYTSQEMLGRDLAEVLMSPAQRAAHRAVIARWNTAERSNGPWTLRTYTTEALHKDQRLIPVQVQVTPVLQADGTVVFHGVVHKLVPL